MKRSPMPVRKAPLKATTIRASAKRTPLHRYAAIQPSARRMRQSRSTGTPTKAESAHIDTIKHGTCVCCDINRERGIQRADWEGCDGHHTLSGGRRRGHMATLGLCPWHHRGVKPYDWMPGSDCAAAFGPSLEHGSKPFHTFYGTDDELLARQAAKLAGERV